MSNVCVFLGPYIYITCAFTRPLVLVFQQPPSSLSCLVVEGDVAVVAVEIEDVVAALVVVTEVIEEVVVS